MLEATSIEAKDCYIVSDAVSCKPLERWALGKGMALRQVVNTGKTGDWGGL